MLLQNLHHRYLYIVIRLPHLKDLDQKIPSFPNCDNYGICRASNPNPLNDDTKTNDNELHQQLCITFKIDYLQEMNIITKVKARLECKINVTLPVLLPNKIVQDSRGPETSSEKLGVKNMALGIRELYHYCTIPVPVIVLYLYAISIVPSFTSRV